MKKTDIVSVHEAKTHLSRLLVEVERGKTITIRRGNEVIAEIIPARSKGRRLGTGKGVVISDDFDKLPDDFMAYFKK